MDPKFYPPLAISYTGHSRTFWLVKCISSEFCSRLPKPWNQEISWTLTSLMWICSIGPGSNTDTTTYLFHSLNPLARTCTRIHADCPICKAGKWLLVWPNFKLYIRLLHFSTLFGMGALYIICHLKCLLKGDQWTDQPPTDPLPHHLLSSGWKFSHGVIV